MATGVVRSANTLILNSNVSSFPHGVSAIHTVDSEKGLKALLNGTKKKGIAYLRIEELSLRLVRLIQKTANERRTQKIRVGHLMIHAPQVQSDYLEWVIEVLLLSTLSFGPKTVLVGLLTPLQNSKLQNHVKCKPSSFHHEMIVVHRLKVREDPSCVIGVRDVITLASYLDQVATLILRHIPLEELLMVEGNVKNLSSEKSVLWSAFGNVRQIMLLECSFTLEGIEKLLCFFAWTPKLKVLSIAARPDLKAKLVKEINMRLGPSDDIRLFQIAAMIILKK